MVKKATPLERASRMLDLVPFLHSHQGISVDELGTEFKIERKELLQDLQALWMCGENKFDYMELDFESDYVFIRNADTLKAIRSLATTERIALIIGLTLIEADLSDEDIRAEVTTLRNKLGVNLESQVSATPLISSADITLIDKAISSRTILEFSYYSPSNDSKTSRKVDPLYCKVEHGIQYMVAHCHTSGAQRTFRLDRISNLAILEERAKKSEAKSIEKPLMEVTVKLHKDLRRNRESLGGSVIQKKDSLQVKIFSEYWLLRTVFSGLGGIELIEPDDLRESIHKRAMAVRALYR